MTVNQGNVIKATARMELLGSIAIQNVFHAELTAGAPVSDVDAIADMGAWLNSFYTVFNGGIVNDLAYIDIVVRNRSLNVELGTTAWPTLTVGGSGSNIMAAGVSMVITAYTLVNKVRGRKFIGAMHDLNIVDSLFTSAAVANMVTAAATWITPFTGAVSGASWTPGVVDKTNTFRGFREVVVRAVPGYQRRRKQNVGI